MFRQIPLLCARFGEKKGWRVQIHNLGNYNNKNTNRVSKPIVIDQVSVFQAGDIWAWINEMFSAILSWSVVPSGHILHGFLKA